MEVKTGLEQYQQPLIHAGLSPEQALIYEYLIKNGPSPAGKISLKTPLKRGLVYKILEQLTKIGLVTKKDQPGKVADFEPAHPLKLKALAEKREEQAKLAQTALNEIIDQLTSDFKLTIGKPGVRFYEGLEGVKKVAFDNLNSKGEILAYVDMFNIEKYFSDINKKYVAVRERLAIKKRNLVNDTPENRKLLSEYHRNITDIRLMKLKNMPMQFTSMLQIYDHKISYITMSAERMIGVIIDDKNIAEMHRQLYLYTWEFAEPLAPLNKI